MKECKHKFVCMGYDETTVFWWMFKSKDPIIRCERCGSDKAKVIIYNGEG